MKSVNVKLKCNNPICESSGKWCTPKFMHLPCKSKYCEIIDKNRIRIGKVWIDWSLTDRDNKIENSINSFYCIKCGRLGKGSEEWREINTWFALHYLYLHKDENSMFNHAMEQYWNFVESFKFIFQKRRYNSIKHVPTWTWVILYVDEMGDLEVLASVKKKDIYSNLDILRKYSLLRGEIN